MKKILLISLFFGATNLFAQQQQDSILVKEIPTIKNNLLQQQQEIDALTKKLTNQNYAIGKQTQNISSITIKLSSITAVNDNHIFIYVNK